MTKSLKKQQVALLKVEKQALTLGAGIAALTATSGAHAEEVLGETVAAHAETVKAAYLNLVATMQAAHDAMEATAQAVGAELLQARGTPKDPVLEGAKSLLGLG